MVRATRYPNCCNAAVLYAFGDCTNANNENGDSMEKEELRKAISGHENIYAKEGYSVLTATINSEQVRVAEVLDSLEWESTPWIEKGKARGTLLKFYWKVIGKGTVESVEEWDKQKKKEDEEERRRREEEMEEEVQINVKRMRTNRPYLEEARDEYSDRCRCAQCLAYARYKSENAI